MKGQQLKLLLIHLGTKPPRILSANLDYLSRVFPDKEILVATDLPKHFKKLPRQVTLLELPSAGFVSQIRSSPHSVHFRSGYWLYTIKRLGAIADAHAMFPSDSLLHIESDMLLLPNFDFTALESRNRVCWTRVTELHDMPGLLFSPSSEESSWLAKTIVDLLIEDESLVDMSVLRRIATEFPEQMNYLNNSVDNVTKDDQSDQLKNEALPPLYDGLAIGPWLFGEDPRNHWGILRTGLVWPPDVLLDCSKVEFKFTQRRLLCRSKGGTVYFEVQNLHIHSKSTRLFKPQRLESELTKSVNRSNSGRSRISISLWGLTLSAIQLLRAGHRKLIGIWENVNRI